MDGFTFSQINVFLNNVFCINRKNMKFLFLKNLFKNKKRHFFSFHVFKNHQSSCQDLKKKYNIINKKNIKYKKKTINFYNLKFVMVELAVRRVCPRDIHQDNRCMFTHIQYQRYQPSNGNSHGEQWTRMSQNYSGISFFLETRWYFVVVVVVIVVVEG